MVLGDAGSEMITLCFLFLFLKEEKKKMRSKIRWEPGPVERDCLRPQFPCILILRNRTIMLACNPNLIIVLGLLKFFYKKKKKKKREKCFYQHDSSTLRNFYWFSLFFFILFFYVYHNTHIHIQEEVVVA